MKFQYLSILILLSLFFFSCYEDKGNYDYHELNQAEVSGIESGYRRDLLSQLDITPVIQSADNSRTYNYLWLCYNTLKSDVVQKMDTLGREKDLKWTVSLDPGEYQLIFAYKDKQTDVIKYIYSKLEVEAKYSRGWYVMKQKGENADIDFFSPDFENGDLIYKVRGSALNGKPLNLGFISDYAFLDEEKGEMSKNNMCLMLGTDKEFQVVRINDLRMVGDLNSLFFEKPAVQIPGKWFGGSDEHGLVNAGKVYTIDVHTGALGNAKFGYPKAGDYEVDDIITKNGTMCPLLFDSKSSKFCTVNRGNPNLIYLESDDQSLFPEAYPGWEPIYAGFLDEGMWEGGKGYVVMQRKEGDKVRSVLHFDLKCMVSWEPSVFKNRIMVVDEVPADSEMAKAVHFGMNRTSQMLYFSVGDQLYYYNLQNKVETKVKRVKDTPAVPTGEQIVMIKHIIFNNSYSASDEFVDKLIVGTSDGTNYKVYLFETTSDKVKDEPLVYKGQGVPTDVVYMSSKMGNGYFCY